MDGTMYGWIGSNYMMICKTKDIWTFKANLHYPFNYVMQGGEGGGGGIHHKHYKTMFV